MRPVACKATWCVALASALTVFSGSPGAAQDSFSVHLTVKPAWSGENGFDAPEVVYLVSREDFLSDEEDIRHLVTPQPKVVRNSNAYEYGTRHDERIGDLRYEGDYVHIDVRRPPYVVTNPLLLRVQLRETDLGHPIVRTIQLDHPKNLSRIYRDEANFILRGGQLDASRVSQAEASAMSAIQHHTAIENYLLLARVVRAGLKLGSTELATVPETINDLAALDGFADLSVENQWKVMLEFLEVMASPEFTNQPTGRGGTVSEAAVRLGGEMREAYGTIFPAEPGLDLLKVYRTLSFIHVQKGDCLMLIENAEMAIAVAPQIDMSWNDQRRFLGEWGNCLDAVSGVSNAASADETTELVLASAGDAFLGGLWSDYAAAVSPSESRLRFSTAQDDRTILTLYEFATRVRLEMDG